MIYARFLDGPLAGETLHLRRDVNREWDGTWTPDFVCHQLVEGVRTELRYVREGEPVYPPHDDPIVSFRLHQEGREQQQEGS